MHLILPFIPMIVRYFLVPIASAVAGYFLTDDPVGVAAGVAAAAQAVIHANDRKRDRETALFEKKGGDK